MYKLSVTLVFLTLAALVHSRNTVQYGSDDIGDLRLVDGSNRCQGRLEIRPDSSVEFGQACDNDVGRNEARVICRQLNCGSKGASVVSATKFLSAASINVYRGFGYVCSSGNETSITSCRRTGSNCDTKMDSYFIGIECSSALIMAPLTSCILIMAVVSLLLR